MISRRAALATSLVLGTSMMVTMAQSQEAKMNVQEWEAAAQLLNDTASLIQKNGWQQAAETAVSEDCFATALEKAFRANPKYTFVDLNYARAVMNETIGAKEVPVEIMAFAKNEPAVPYWGKEYMDWNDKPDQTADAVIGTIQSAAQKALELSKEAAAQ